MLQHCFSSPQVPTRVVVLGSRGFVGRHLVTRLQGLKIPTLALGSDALDLTTTDSAEQLAGLLRSKDAVIMLATLTPDKGRGVDPFLKNLQMAANMVRALEKSPVAHVVYLSSDAVYAASNGLLNEATPADPDDLYGAMHKARETIFKQIGKAPLAILRSTLIFGPGDTHNSYGPNRFRRTAAQGGKIVLRGGGEETRDHLYVCDLCQMIIEMLQHRSSGLLNAATGQSVSFNDIAIKVAGQFSTPAIVEKTPRTTPVTHRYFDITAIRKSFPQFRFTPLTDALVETRRLENINLGH